MKIFIQNYNYAVWVKATPIYSTRIFKYSATVPADPYKGTSIKLAL